MLAYSNAGNRFPSIPAYNEKLASYGQWTYRAAWALEITAATIGLATGLVLGYQAAIAKTEFSSADLALASAPFFMVALAELTKIPIATLLYTTSSWLWKVILCTFLVALAGITFETVFMGLERAATNRQLQIEAFTQQINVLAAEDLMLDSTVRRLRETNEADLVRSEIENLIEVEADERKAIADQISALNDEVLGQTISSKAARALEALNAREQRLEVITKERDAEISVAVQEFERQRESYAERINKATDPKLRDAWAEELRQLRNPRSAIIARFEPQLDAIRTEIGTLQGEYDRIRLEEAPISATQRAEIDRRKADLIQQMERSNQAAAARKKAADDRLADAQRRENEEADLIELHQARRDEVALKLSKIEADRIPIAREDQIRRIAGRVYGRTPEGVSVDEASFIALIWFSSLAALAALAGPLTAIVALGLQKAAARDERSEANTRIGKSLRRLLLGWRWKRVRTVEKVVEVPVEKIIKEILYIPILTDDPNAVRATLAQGVPPEVADLVKVSLMGAPSAGKA